MKRLLSFCKNRLINRPHCPRDPCLKSFLKSIGVEWPEPEPELSEESEEGEDGWESEESESEESEEPEDPVRSDSSKGVEGGPKEGAD